MTYPRSVFRKSASSLARREQRSRELRYIWAVTLVAAGLLVRFVLQPVFGASHTYTAFYPVVLIAAYLLGPRPAILATVLSGAVAYWGFAQPDFAWKLDPKGGAALAFFAGTSAVAIYLITGLNRALEELAARQSRAEALAHSHAELFRELNERVTNHLQLISGLLALQARGEADTALSGALTRASERSLDIARIHREVAGQTGGAVDFRAFAASLVRASIVPVEVSGESLRLPRDQATSLGVVVLECVSALTNRKADGRIRVMLGGGPSTARLRIGLVTGTAGISTASLADAFLLRAMVEQLGGRLRLHADVEGTALELSFPIADAPEPTEPAFERAAATVH